MAGSDLLLAAVNSSQRYVELDIDDNADYTRAVVE
jgi:hypothetical protein